MSREDIEYLSQPDSVSMGDQWFEVADLVHFWIRRRFEVFRGLVPDLQKRRMNLAEIGCGHGLVQRQFEDELDLSLDGFDLNDGALKQNISRRSRLVCYDVLARRAELRSAYQGIVLFDVIEHIADEDSFLEAVLHLLGDGGEIYVNIPAFMDHFSEYDTAAGHVRRYDHAMLKESAGRVGLAVKKWTYWGLPMVPLLWLRKRALAGATDDDVIKKGFKPPAGPANRLLLLLSRLERIPQHRSGTSLMAVLERG